MPRIGSPPVESRASPNQLTALLEAGRQASVNTPNADNLAATIQALAARGLLYGFDGTAWDRLLADAPADALTQPARGLDVLAMPHSFNESTWDRLRGNTELTLLANATRSSTTLSAEQTSYNARGVIVWIYVSAVPGGDTVALNVHAKDPVSGAFANWLRGGAVAGLGNYDYVVYPGVVDTTAEVHGEQAMPIPRSWRIQVVHSGAGNFTYSVGACLII